MRYARGWCILVFLAIYTQISCRSPLRPYEPTPEIITYWEQSPDQQYSLRDSHLEEGPIFKTFDKEFFFDHLLPDEPIQFRVDPQHCIDGAVLSDLAENLVQELREKKKKYTDFIVLKSTDYNPGEFCGLLVLKYKNYPFVLKLFIENPSSFVQPYNKGLEPASFFIMGGGIMRHLTGFTRIQNQEAINKLIQADPYWSQIADTPRKWNWLPKNCSWFMVEGRNIGKKNKLSVRLPAIYGIIADEIVIDKKKTLLNRHHALRCMRLCQFTDYRIDPHIQNFRIERSTGKLVLIDTENFRMLVGLKEHFCVDSYISWYLRLGAKFTRDALFRDKYMRQQAQTDESWQLVIN